MVALRARAEGGDQCEFLVGVIVIAAIVMVMIMMVKESDLLLYFVEYLES